MFLMDHPGFLNMLLAAPGFLGFAGTGGRSRPSRSQDMDRRAVMAFDTWKQNRWKFGHKLPAGRYHPLAITYHNSIQFLFMRIYTILSCSLFPIYFSYLLKQSSMLADSFTVNMSKPVWGHEAQLVFWPWLSAKHISFVFAVFHLRLLLSEAWKRSSQKCTCRRFAELDEVGTQKSLIFLGYQACFSSSETWDLPTHDIFNILDSHHVWHPMPTLTLQSSAVPTVPPTGRYDDAWVTQEFPLKQLEETLRTVAHLALHLSWVW